MNAAACVNPTSGDGCFYAFFSIGDPRHPDPSPSPALGLRCWRDSLGNSWRAAEETLSEMYLLRQARYQIFCPKMRVAL